MNQITDKIKPSFSSHVPRKFQNRWHASNKWSQLVVSHASVVLSISTFLQMGLVCFRILGDDDDGTMTTKLLNMLNHTRDLHVIPARVGGKVSIRFCIVAEDTRDIDIGS